eukprot:1157998-Pelagomonas_calceolata.AAC.1
MEHSGENAPPTTAEPAAATPSTEAQEPTPAAPSTEAASAPERPSDEAILNQQNHIRCDVKTCPQLDHQHLNLTQFTIT